MSRRSTKQDLVGELISEFRASGNHDRAFDALAADRLGVNATDLHCLNIIENAGGVTAGELAREAGLTTGAVTGVVDRLERAGYAQRVPDQTDRRRVSLQVTDLFRSRAGEIWGPVASEWHKALAGRFSAGDLETIIDFLAATNAIGERHIARLADE
jgi:DNA-binding MarR family transcriptional regulator